MSNGNAGSESSRGHTMQGHGSLSKIFDFILMKLKSPKKPQSKDEDNAFRKQNKLTKLGLP